MWTFNFFRFHCVHRLKNRTKHGQFSATVWTAILEAKKHPQMDRMANGGFNLQTGAIGSSVRCSFCSMLVNISDRKHLPIEPCKKRDGVIRETIERLLRSWHLMASHWWCREEEWRGLAVGCCGYVVAICCYTYSTSFPSGLISWGSCPLIDVTLNGWDSHRERSIARLTFWFDLPMKIHDYPQAIGRLTHGV